MANPVSIRFGGYQGPASVHTRAGNAFGDALRDVLGDRIDFTFDANIVDRGHKAADLLTMVEAGDLDACYFSSSYLAGRVPELGVFDQHFIVPDRRRAYAILDGALGRRLTALVAKHTGFAVLGFWDNGFRHISSRHPILTPADAHGLRIRTLANDNHQRVFRALGFEPVAIDVRDLPAAVVDGTVDAQENPLTNTYNFGLHTTHKHITLTRHLMGIALMLFNKSAVAAWPDPVRAAIDQAIAVATQAQRRFADEDDEICAAKLRAAGTTLHELSPAQRQAFADATAAEVAATRAQFDSGLIALFDADLSA